MSRLPQPGVLSLSASHCRAQAPYGTAVSGTACRGIASHKAEGLDPQRRAWLCSEGDWKLALGSRVAGSAGLVSRPGRQAAGLGAGLQVRSGRVVRPGTGDVGW